MNNICRPLENVEKPKNAHSAGASLNEPPNYSNWPSIFWRPYLVATLPNDHRKQGPSFSRYCPRNSSVWAHPF